MKDRSAQLQEIIQLRAKVAGPTAQWQEANRQVEAARGELLRAEQQPVAIVLSMDTRATRPKATKAAEVAAAQAREEKLKGLRAQLAAAEKRLTAIPSFQRDAQRLTELKAALDRDRRVEISNIVQAAAQAAPSRDEYNVARGRYVGLTENLAALTAELDRLAKSDPRTLQEPIETRAARLIATGELDAQPAPDVSQRIRELVNQQSIVRSALQIQDRVVSDALHKYSLDIIAAARDEITCILRGIVSAFEQAREWTLRARLLRIALAAHADSGLLPAIECPEITCPTGDPDGWTTWLDRMRDNGFAV